MKGQMFLVAICGVLWCAPAEATIVNLRGNGVVDGTVTSYTCNTSLSGLAPDCTTPTTSPSLFDATINGVSVDFDALIQGPVEVTDFPYLGAFNRDSPVGSFFVRYLGPDSNGFATFDAENVSASLTTVTPSARCDAFALTCTFNSFSYSGGSFALTADVPIVAPVPEPATWAMMLLGFFGISLAQRMKQRQVKVAG